MLGNVVAAFDGSDHAWEAVRVAAQIARAARREVVVVQVAQPAVPGESAPDAVHAADRAVRMIKDSGVSARLDVRSSLPARTAEEILAEAHDENAWMIVMGTRGRSEVTSFLLGSVAHKVIHLSDIPVMVVPHGG